LDEKGNLSEEKNIFISKRNCKLNWISELYTLKQGISKEWIQILSKENSF